MWDLGHKEGWALKNWCFLTVVLEKTLENLLDSKEIKPVNPKGNQLWIFIGRKDAEAEPPIFWPPNAKSQLIGKDPDAGEDWGQEERGETEDQMLDGIINSTDLSLSKLQEIVKDKDGSLACYSPSGHKELDMTEWLNNNNPNNIFSLSCPNKWQEQMAFIIKIWKCYLL